MKNYILDVLDKLVEILIDKLYRYRTKRTIEKIRKQDPFIYN